MLLGSALKGKAQTVQYVSLVTTDIVAGAQYTLQTNQIISCVGFYGSGSIDAYAPGLTTGAPIVIPSPTCELVPLFTGLTNIIVKASGEGGGFVYATFRITTPYIANVISNYVPADAIVIPASATGNVQIILESSPDLVNWTAANPGTYGPSAATNRFFRVRAVLN